MILLWIGLAICYVTTVVAIGIAVAALSHAVEAKAELYRRDPGGWYPRLNHGHSEASDEALSN